MRPQRCAGLHLISEKPELNVFDRIDAELKLSPEETMLVESVRKLSRSECRCNTSMLVQRRTRIAIEQSSFNSGYEQLPCQWDRPSIKQFDDDLDISVAQILRASHCCTPA